MPKIKSFFDLVVAKLSQLFVLVLGYAKLVLSFLFGQFSWNKPAWIAWVSSKLSAVVRPFLRQKLSAGLQWAKANKTRSFAGSGAILILILVSLFGYQWWKHQPKPTQVTASVSGPELTRLDDQGKPQPVSLSFSASVAPLDKIGKIVTEGISLEPRPEGNWKWDSATSLVFYPKKDWPIDQTYSIKLNQTLIAKEFVLKENQISFRSKSFGILNQSSEFYQHPEIPKEKRVTAKLNVSHPVDPDSLKDKVTITLGGNADVLGNIPMSYGAQLTYDKYFGKIYIVSDIIPIPNKDAVATIKIAKGWSSSRGGNKIESETSFTVPVPGRMTFFKVLNAQFQFVENKKYELEQIVSVETSTDVLAKDFDQSVEFFLLPQVNPEQPEQKNYVWQAGEVSDAVLKKSKKIQGTRVPDVRPQSKNHLFKMNLPPDRSLFVRVNKGLKAFNEYELAESFNDCIRVQNFPQEIRILHEGAILPLSGEKRLSVLTRGIKSYQVEVGHVLSNQLNHMLSQSNGDFANPRFTAAYTFDWNNISEKYTEIVDASAATSGRPQFTFFDAGKYVSKSHGGRGMMYVSLRPYNRETKRTYGRREARFLLVSDLGIVEKQMADNSHEIFVQSIFGGTPVNGAKIEVIGKNGVSVASTTTNAEGRAKVNDFATLINEKQPIAYVVQKNADLSFLPLNRTDRQLQYSRFDVGGIRTRGETNRLQAYISTDRGLYRPGETYHASAIIRSFNWKTELTGVPVEWVVTDSKNQEVYKEKITLDSNGFIELNNQTQDTSFTGTYTASLYLINNKNNRDGLLGSSTFRVEEFLPDRMKISSGFSIAQTSGWVSPEGLKAWTRVMTLFGYPAEKRRVKARFSMSPAAPYFAKYPEHRFYFPKTEKSFEETLSETETNEKGESEYDLNLGRFEKGNYHVRFQAESFEASGGRSVVTESSMMVSPYKYFIGYHTNSDLNYLKMDSKHSIDYLAIDPNLKPTDVKDLNIAVIEKQWISVLTKQGNGTFKYESVLHDREVSKTKWAISSKGTKFDLPTADPGDYKLIVTDPEGLEVSYLEFNVVGEKNVLGKLSKSSELQIKLNRTDYSAGEEIELQIRAPYVGSGLITIERDKVYASKWFKTNSTSSLQKIKVPEGIEGNAYINVTFLRDINSREIFMSPLSYGVVPFSIDLKKRQLKIELKSATETRPGEPLKIEFTGNRKGKIIVFAVDEGILQVAKYQTPDPLKTFFQKRALEVQTSQLLDLVLPEYKLVKELSASGGDGDNGLSRNLNPFRRKGKPPVAFWSGIIDLDTTKKSVTYNVPDYFNGSLRVMALAVNPESVGVSRTDTLVKGDFILTPTVPVVLTPGDEAFVGVSVFNNLKGSGANAKVHFEVKSTDQLEILEGATADLSIPETKEVTTQIKVRAKEALGVADINFIASIGKKSSHLQEDLSLRPASPYRSTVVGGIVTNGKEKVDVSRAIYPEYARRSFAISFLPLILAHGLSEFLSDNPYGCTEQLLSKAFPTLILGDKPDFGFTPAQRDTTFKKTIATLRQRQTPDGGFGLYWSYGDSAKFPSLYAAHYLLEAQERGFGVPSDLQARVLAFLRLNTNQSPTDVFSARMAAYAIYLLARNGQNVGNQITTLNKEIEALPIKKEWKSDIGALFMAGAYKIMHQDELAEKMSSELVPVTKYFAFFSSYHDQYTHNALMLYLLAKHFPEKLKGHEAPAVDSFVSMIKDNHYSTLNSSIVILALEAITKAGDTVEVASVVSELDAESKSKGLIFPKALFPKAKFSAAAKSLQIENKSEQRIFYQAHMSGFDIPSSLKPVSEKIEVQREYRMAKSTDVATKTKLGEELEVHIKVKSTDGQDHPNVAIVDLLPSGFEIVMERGTQAKINIQDLLQHRFPTEAPAKKWVVWLSPLVTSAYAQEGDGGETEADTGEQEYRGQAENDDGNGQSDAGEGNDEAPQAQAVANGESPDEQSAAIPTLAQPGSSLRVDFEDAREDRLVLYTTVSSNPREYIYKIKATNRGTFKIPAAFAEDMYDKSAQSLGPIGSITVEDNK